VLARGAASNGHANHGGSRGRQETLGLAKKPESGKVRAVDRWITLSLGRRQ